MQRVGEEIFPLDCIPIINDIGVCGGIIGSTASGKNFLCLMMAVSI